MDSAEFEQNLAAVEKKLDRLRSLYDQWLRGYERCEPQVARREVERTINTMRRYMPRNTALRFRFQQLLQRHTLYTTRWGRLARQVEEGTSKVEQQRIQRRKERDSEPPARADEAPGPHALELDLESNLSCSATRSSSEFHGTQW